MWYQLAAAFLGLLPPSFFFGYAVGSGLMILLYSCTASIRRTFLVLATPVLFFFLLHYLESLDVLRFLEESIIHATPPLAAKEAQSIVLSCPFTLAGKSACAHNITIWVPGKTSHTICLALGVAISHWHFSFSGKHKFWSVFLAGVVLHSCFLTGSFLWWWAVIPTALEYLDPVSVSFGIVLAVTHSLAFSVGMFFYRDYRARGFHKSPEMEVLCYYCARGVALLLFPLIWEPVSSIYDVDIVSKYAVQMGLLMLVCLHSRIHSLGTLHHLWETLSVGSLLFFVVNDTEHVLGSLHRSLPLPLDPYTSNEAIVELPLRMILLWVSLFLYAGGAAGFTYQYFKLATSPVLFSPPVPRAEYVNKQRRKTWPHPYPNGWYCLVTSEEVPPGKAVRISALGREFVVFRAHQDDEACDLPPACVLDGYCPHMGASLSAGQVVGDSIECPFHGWRFDGGGKCTHVPYSSLCPTGVKARTYDTIERDGLILVWFHVKDEPPAYAFPPLPHRDTLQRLPHSQVYEADMHIQEWIESGADYARFNWMHGSLSPRSVGLFHLAHTVKWFPSPDPAQPHVCHFTDHPVLTLTPFNLPIFPGMVKVYVTANGPGSVTYFEFITPHGMIVLVKTFLPLEPLRQHIRDVWYAEPAVPYLLRRYLINEATSGFFDDIAVWASKVHAPAPYLIKDDGPIMQYRRWYKQFYKGYEVEISSSSGSDAPPPVPAALAACASDAW